MSAFWTCGVCDSNESPSAYHVGRPCGTFQSHDCESASVCACKYTTEGALVQPVHAPPPSFLKLHVLLRGWLHLLRRWCRHLSSRCDVSLRYSWRVCVHTKTRLAGRRHPLRVS